ncbi:MAG: PHP domain-containing protein [candidate division WOR-3 bacterium]
MGLNNEPVVDLHLHTIFSDGLLTPEEMVLEAHKLGLAAVAITDHDSVDGIKPAQETGKRLKLEIVPGVEMSSTVAGVDVHILGYYLDIESPEVLDFFALVRKKRRERAERMVAKLNELGVRVTMERVAHFARAGAIGRPHVAQALVEAGAVANINEAFSRFIGYDGPAYFPKMRLTPLEAIGFIQRHGGLAFIAHPGTYHNDDAVYAAIAAGADGIEVWHPEHDKQASDHYAELAWKNGLLVSGGSDCHGGAKNGRMFLGQITVPYKHLAAIKRLARKREPSRT